MPHTGFIQERLDFLEIDEQTIAHLRQAGRTLEPVLDQMLDRFYSHILAEPSIRRLFDDELSIERARSAQKKHWLDTLFGGKFDSSYFEKTHQIGQAHARIGLEPHWYIGGYAQMLDQFIDVLMQDESIDRATLHKAVRAIQKAVLLDIDLVIQSYLDAKDETMRTLLHRATDLTSDIHELANGIGDEAQAIRAIANEADESVDNFEDQATSLMEHSKRLTGLIESLDSRLQKVYSGDRLYITGPDSGTGPIARLMSLVRGSSKKR